MKSVAHPDQRKPSEALAAEGRKTSAGQCFPGLLHGFDPGHEQSLGSGIEAGREKVIEGVGGPNNHGQLVGTGCADQVLRTLDRIRSMLQVEDEKIQEIIFENLDDAAPVYGDQRGGKDLLPIFELFDKSGHL